MSMGAKSKLAGILYIAAAVPLFILVRYLDLNLIYFHNFAILMVFLAMAIPLLIASFGAFTGTSEPTFSIVGLVRRQDGEMEVGSTCGALGPIILVFALYILSQNPTILMESEPPFSLLLISGILGTLGFLKFTRARKRHYRQPRTIPSYLQSE